MTETAAPTSWPCEICRKPSVPRVHDGCEDRIRENLQKLPVLYRQLATVLAPGRQGSDGGRGGTKTPPLPVNVAVLDLRARGGIEGVLGSWERDVRDILDWGPPEYRGSVQAAVDASAQFLATNLPWICDQHEAAREFADEIRSLVAEAERLITGEKPERKVVVACPCGQTLRVTVSTPGARCPRCETQYGRDEVLNLPLAERSAA